MNTKYRILVFIGLLIVVSILYAVSSLSFIQKHLDAYALASAEQQFGSGRLATYQEEKIHGVADEMRITQQFIVRKMNHRALAQFGYCNAFAYFPLLLELIPISNQPFLFVSEGFFEDLSWEEQRFLIGHEMVHIQEHHTQYLNLLLLLFLVVLLAIWWFMQKYIRLFFVYCVGNRFTTFSNGLIFSLFGLCFVIPHLTGLAYRRHIEWEADRRSLAVLNSYDGGIKLMNRWHFEFLIPLHNGPLSYIADHPSCFERREYCINLKNQCTEKL